MDTYLDGWKLIFGSFIYAPTTAPPLDAVVLVQLLSSYKFYEASGSFELFDSTHKTG